MQSIDNFIKFMVDNGLVFEINRKVLHPLGLALVVDVERGKKGKLAITALLQTEDTEGFLYDEEGYNVGAEKYNKLHMSKEMQEKLSARLDKYGFIVQDRAKV